MRLPTLFKQRPNKSYSYTPRYYDERKERLEKLIEKHHGKKDGTISHKKVSFRDEWKQLRQTRSDQNSRLRLAVIMVLLFAMAYVALQYIQIDLF
ncbi:MAG: hypothetical protein RQ735_11455 [Flavobacteriaceae bacterium]|nr:hypothetical protein [Flavobacteriaceae bacterium]